jgi:hypothetical protein
MAKDMKVNGKMESFMGKALRLYQMEPFSMANGSKADLSDQACASIQTELNIQETG